MGFKRWKRPESLPFPSTWAVCEGRKPLPNGQIPRFRIQDITDDLIEPAIEHMATFYLFDEPKCKFMGVGNDLEAREEFARMWREVLKGGLGLICLLDNADELEDKALPKIAGVNMTYASFPDSPDPEIKNKKVFSILKLVCEVNHKVDCFTMFNSPVSMCAFGLSVHPAYRGQGLGLHILNARIPLGKAVGIQLTTSSFTGVAAQGAARKAGFEVLAEIRMEDYKEDGKIVFNGVDSTILLMGRKI